MEYLSSEVSKVKVILVFCLVGVLTVTFGLAWLTVQLNRRLNLRLKEGWFSPPVEYYTAEEQIQTGDFLPPRVLQIKLQQRNYTKLSEQGSHLPPGSFISQTGAVCENIKHKKESASPQATHTRPAKAKKSKSQTHCILWRDVDTGEHFSASFMGDKVYSLHWRNRPATAVLLKPFLFAQYENGEPILKKSVPLSQVPFYCLQAVLTAEDHQFILHEGISLKAIGRAVWRNLRAGRLAEGGSTITQQLIKNIFLSPKKSFWRKFQEQIMALLLETKTNKDDILTAYMNMVYMGQSGAFRIHGFGSAAEYYMGKPLSLLNLSECAFLAGLIKSPGRYKPSAKNKKILNRRNHILNTLYKKQIISKKERESAKARPLPHRPPLPSPPIYFTDTVYKKLAQHRLPVKEGLKVFTTLRPMFQTEAGRAVRRGLKWLEEKRLQKTEPDPVLQSALVSVDIATGAVTNIMGGRDFSKSQFNRAVQAKRQIGSLMKPVVALSALIKDPDLNPLSLVEDTQFTHTYDSFSWTPKNYKDRYMGTVALYEALAFSLNAGMARVGLQTGLKPLAQTLQSLGGPEVKKPHPSLILGAVEISPWDTAQIFLTIARMGKHKPLHIIKKVTNLKDQLLYEQYEQEDKTFFALEENKTAVLVGMLREVTRSGTARWLKNFPLPVAGKTGTTNEEKDAWFMGFTPTVLTVVWVGFDDNRSLQLTGAGAALPIWEMFMRKILPFLPRRDFNWPPGVEKQTVEVLQKSPNKKPDKKQKVRLIFEK